MLTNYELNCASSALRLQATNIRRMARSHRWEGETHREHRAQLRGQAKQFMAIAAKIDDLKTMGRQP